MIEIDSKGCSYVDIDCTNGYPINVAYNCYYKCKKYLLDRIKETNEIDEGINAEEVLYKIVTEEGSISIFADWSGVDIRAENIESNILLFELYQKILIDL